MRRHPDFEFESYELPKGGGLSGLGRGIVEYSPYIIAGALLGAGLGGIYLGISQFHQSINPELFQFIRDNFEPKYFWTSREGFELVISDYPGHTIAANSTFGGAAGAAFKKMIS